MKKQALFCDGTSGYVVPVEPKEYETVILRFRTAKDDVEQVFLLTKDSRILLEKQYSKGAFDYYEVKYYLEAEAVSYVFEINGSGETCFYDRTGVADHVAWEYAFRIIPGFTTPDWAKGAVMYQIFVDRFYNGDTLNDVQEREYRYVGQFCEQEKDWYAYPKPMDVHRFYGGDLQGVLDKLDYLEDLGIEVVYFNPLFVSPSNHKYDIQDYDYIDPHYGKIVADGGEAMSPEVTENRNASMYRQRVSVEENLEASNALFIRLVEEMHKRGMKVILDGVFNHCGSFNKWMDREGIYEGQSGYETGAFVGADSPYRDFFRFEDSRDEAWPYNGTYAGWWGHDTLPKLNYEGSEKLEQYILNIGEKWVSEPYNADGWRLDVAADLGQTEAYNHVFWKKFRKVVKEANSEALILAEHYGNPSKWLEGDEWDSVMNYDAFMEPLTWFLTGMEKHSDALWMERIGDADSFWESMKQAMALLPIPSLQTAMNELSNHDHSRFLTRTNRVVGRIGTHGAKAAEEGVNLAVMREAVVFQMTWIGAPTIYYGDEAGLCGFTDPDNRRTYPWGREDEDLLEFHKLMIRIHKTEKALKTGALKMLTLERDVLAYARFCENSQVIVLLNNGEQGKTVTVPVWLAEVPMEGYMEGLIYSYQDGYTTVMDDLSVCDGYITVYMEQTAAMVIRTKKRQRIKDKIIDKIDKIEKRERNR